MRDGQRVAIVLLSAIGDIVHAFPLLSSLKARYPNSRFEWIAHPVPGEVARRHPAVDRVWPLRRGPKGRAFLDLRRELVRERFDLVIDLQMYLKASLVTLLIHSPRKIGFDRSRARELNWLVTREKVPARSLQQIGEEYLEFADYLDAPRKYEWPFLFSEAERADSRLFRERLEAPMAAFVTGTSRREKEWDPRRWATLADALHEEWGYGVCLVGGRSANEDDLARRTIESATSPVADLRADDIGRLAWLLGSAALVVGCDTGPLHLGMSFGAPSIGLFGATDPARYGPRHESLDLVVDAFHDPGEPWHPAERRRRPGRMDRIQVLDVLAKVELARSRHRRARGEGERVQATDPTGRALPEGEIRGRRGQ
jgi:heptosyltransferase I